MNTFSILIQNICNLFTWLVVVAPWEQALRVRLGKRVELLSAGCYLRIPFVDRVYRQTIRRRMFTIRPQVLTTADGKTITVSGAVGFRIVDLRQLFNTLHDALDTIEAEIASQIGEYVAGQSLLDCTPHQLEEHVASTVDITQYGLADQEYRITNYTVVRTYRFITGDIPAWSNGNAINTQQHEGAI